MSTFTDNDHWGLRSWTVGWRRVRVMDADDSDDEIAEDDDWGGWYGDGQVETCVPSDDEDEIPDGAAGEADEEEVNLMVLYVEDLQDDEKSEHAINMMWNLVCGKSENTKARNDFAAAERSAPALIDAMRKHDNSADLQWKCCSLLIGITFRHNLNKSRLNERGAADAVIDAMKKFRYEEKIQQSGCGALRNLSSLKSHQQYVIEAGGIEAVVGAMAAFPEVSRLQKCACDCLYNFANSSDVNRRPIIKKGGCVALAECQLLFESKTEKFDMEVYKSATEALKVLNSWPVVDKPANGPSVRGSVVKLR